MQISNVPIVCITHMIGTITAIADKELLFIATFPADDAELAVSAKPVEAVNKSILQRQAQTFGMKFAFT